MTDFWSLTQNIHFWATVARSGGFSSHNRYWSSAVNPVVDLKAFTSRYRFSSHCPRYPFFFSNPFRYRCMSHCDSYRFFSNRQRYRFLSRHLISVSIFTHQVISLLIIEYLSAKDIFVLPVEETCFALQPIIRRHDDLCCPSGILIINATNEWQQHLQLDENDSL